MHDLIWERDISGSEIRFSCCFNYHGMKTCFLHLVEILWLFYIPSKQSKGSFTAVKYVILNEFTSQYSEVKLRWAYSKKYNFAWKYNFFPIWKPQGRFILFANIALFVSLFILAMKPPDNPDAEWPQIKKQLWSTIKVCYYMPIFRKLQSHKDTNYFVQEHRLIEGDL